MRACLGTTAHFRNTKQDLGPDGKDTIPIREGEFFIGNLLVRIHFIFFFFFFITLEPRVE